jgi:histidine ammonia-lyase
MRFVLTPATRLSVADLAAIADGAGVDLGPEVEPALAAVRTSALSVKGPVYGRRTGVGANKDVALADSADPSVPASALLHSHATSGGDSRSTRRTRAMLAVRAQQLSRPGSGIAPEVLRSWMGLLEAPELPVVYELGGIGTGDLSALAPMALFLRLDLGPGDALALISSNAATLADAALAVADLQVLARAALVVSSLTFTAVDGNPQAYSPLAEAATPFPGARGVCAAMRQLTEGAAAASRIQDPYGLRCLPQVHGLLLDALATTAGIIETLAATSSENPQFSPHGLAGEVAHHGGFHAAYLATALDTLRSALAQAAQLSQTRLGYLVEPAMTGLLPFLGDRPAASGVMVLEYVAVSALAQLRHSAAPTAIQSVSISRGAEDDASFASLAAIQALAGVSSYRTVVACELVAAVRALRQRGLSVPYGLDGLPDEVRDGNLSGSLLEAETRLPQLADISSGRSSSA